MYSYIFLVELIYLRMVKYLISYDVYADTLSVSRPVIAYKCLYVVIPAKYQYMVMLFTSAEAHHKPKDTLKEFIQERYRTVRRCKNGYTVSISHCQIKRARIIVDKRNNVLDGYSCLETESIDAVLEHKEYFEE